MKKEMGHSRKFKSIQIGASDFKELIEGNHYFVDSATRCNMKSIA